jgi:predicted CopG family antitoxin
VARGAPGGQCLIHVEAAVVDRLVAVRGPGESYSDVILRLVEIEAGQRR